MKKPRNKKYQGPKYVCRNVFATVFGGMGGTHIEHLRDVQIKNHLAMAEMAQGRGTREQWNLIVGAINIANIMCEQGIGDEFRAKTIAARNALLAVGKRAVLNEERFIFTGPELQAINEALEIHDAQLENSRAIDVDRAAMEVERRVRFRINSTSVMAEVRKDRALQNAA
jgi:hypothetical protein